MIMPTVTAGRQYLAAAFLIMIGLGASGCGDTATVNQGAQLGSLTVSPGTLSPTFSGGTTQYNVQLDSNVSSVTVTAQPAVGGDTVTINNQPTTSSVITLGKAGTTTTASISVSGSGADPRTYIVSLVRAGLNGNNSLESLAVSPGALAPAFAMNTQDYTVDVANTVGSVNITPTLDDPNATMTVNGQPAISGQPRAITLKPAGQSTLITTVVTAQNNAQKPYRVTVSRGVSGNNNLLSLGISPGGTLTPAFSAGTVGYTVNVGSNVSSVTVTAAPQDGTASLTITSPTTNGQGPSPRSITLEPAGSSTPVFIVVTAQNGTQKTYTVGVNRAALGGNNNLSNLTVSPGSLTPTFSAGTEDYTVSVVSTVTSVTVTATRQDSNASVRINGQTTNSRSITLNGPGSNTVVNIVVIAQNGSQKTYTATVNRQALGGNNNLSGLTVSPGALDSAFSANDLNYTVNVGSNVANVTVSATKADPNAVMSNDVTAGAGTATGQASIPLGGPGTTTTVLIDVTAPNGSSKTYRINVIKAALASNNNLSALRVTPGTLSPNFASGTTAYTVNVATNVTSVTVSATKADSNAVISGDLPTQGQATIQLDGPGTSKTVSIVVTAPSGAQKTYAINVNRAAPSSNNSLSALSVTPGTLSPAFAASTTAYTVNVASDVTSLAVTATLADTAATMTIEGQGTSSGQARSIGLGAAGSSTAIDIVVIAPNGSSKTYTITVNRAAAVSPPPAPASAPDLTPASDSGFLPGQDSDNITNDLTPGFFVPQPAAGETPNLYVAIGANPSGKVPTSFDPATNTLTMTNPLPGGDYFITVTSTATNAAGLESPQSPSLSVHIDNVAPGGP